MDIIKDNRISKAIYVDSANNHCADKAGIVKFIISGYASAVDKYVAILAGGYHLNEAEAAVLKHIVNNNGTELSGQVCVAVAKVINKSTATVARAIATLRDKRLIYGDGAKAVKLSSSINTSVQALANAQFFVIEVNPEVTSPKIEL